MDVPDLMEDILIRSSVQDLVLWKRVCKSWYSLISSSRFAKLHIKKTYNKVNNHDTDDDRIHVRIAVSPFWGLLDESLYDNRNWKLVGSCNGLVCLAPLPDDGLVLVNNPWTGETRKLSLPPSVFDRNTAPCDVCLSFGYDSITDDYKVVLGIQKSTNETTLFLVFSLKSNTWKLIEKFKYWSFMHCQPGILFKGALHWFVLDHSTKMKKKVIVSFDLSREDFKVIPQPNDSRYSLKPRCNMLAILEDQLCILFLPNITNDSEPPCDIWIMRNYNDEQSWERLPYDYEKFVAVRLMRLLKCTSPEKNVMPFFCDDRDDNCLSRRSKYVVAPRFTPSLVSPYADM